MYYSVLNMDGLIVAQVMTMRKNLGKKLRFTPETIRALVDHDLHGVGGGAIAGCSYATTKCVSTGSINKCYSALAINC